MFLVFFSGEGGGSKRVHFFFEWRTRIETKVGFVTLVYDYGGWSSYIDTYFRVFLMKGNKSFPFHILKENVVKLMT